MTEREGEVIETLATRVRVLSLAQLSRTWWSADEVGMDAATRELARLSAAGWLRRSVVEAHPEFALDEPLLAWNVGDPEPDFGPLLWRQRARWGRLPERTTTFRATAHAAAVFGGFAPHVKPQSTAHDLHVGALYLRLRAADPVAATRWVSEDELAREREGEALPDAVLRGDDGRLLRVIEFVGSSYTTKRLRALHFDCFERRLPYELW